MRDLPPLSLPPNNTESLQLVCFSLVENGHGPIYSQVSCPTLILSRTHYVANTHHTEQEKMLSKLCSKGGVKTFSFLSFFVAVAKKGTVLLDEFTGAHEEPRFNPFLSFTLVIKHGLNRSSCPSGSIHGQQCIIRPRGNGKRGKACFSALLLTFWQEDILHTTYFGCAVATNTVTLFLPSSSGHGGLLNDITQWKGNNEFKTSYF